MEIPRTEEKFEADFWKRWNYEQNIGHGAAGVVLRIRSRETGRLKALKLIGPNPPGDRLAAEIDMMCALKEHNADLQLYESVHWIPRPPGVTFSTKVLQRATESGVDLTRTYGLLMELAVPGDLDDYVEGEIEKNMTELRMKFRSNPANLALLNLMTKNQLALQKQMDQQRAEKMYATQKLSRDGQRWMLEAARSLVRQLQCIHDAGYEHRDLKPNNVLYDAASNRFHIADFDLSGSAREIHRPVGTIGYMAPELFIEEYAAKPDHRPADIWSLGAVLYYLHTGRDLISADMLVNGMVESNNSKMGRVISTLSALMPEQTDISFIITDMLDYMPENRLSLHEALDAIEMAIGRLNGIGARGGRGGGGGRRGGFRSPGPRRGGASFPRPARRGFAPAYRRPAYYRGGRRGGGLWWRPSIWRPLWFTGLLPLWYASALPFYSPYYPTYPITVGLSDELALRAELESLRAQNAALLRDGRYSLVPDLERGRYVWIQNPGY
jgi:serine/threonine protein kinase